MLLDYEFSPGGMQTILIAIYRRICDFTHALMSIASGNEK